MENRLIWEAVLCRRAQTPPFELPARPEFWDDLQAARAIGPPTSEIGDDADRSLPSIITVTYFLPNPS